MHGVHIPWYTEAQRDWYEFDGGGIFDVPKTASITHDVLRNRTSFTCVFRSTPAYSAHVSHSVRDNGTSNFCFKLLLSLTPSVFLEILVKYPSALNTPFQIHYFGN